MSGTLANGGLPAWMDADEAAAFLRLTRKALYAAVARGQVPAHRLGRRRLRFRRADLERLLAGAGL